ncbi:MAG: hypothetical protein A2358_02405 [Candidatus Staskawiczbacteria bacterium RIFOXYB1_FULL_37_44]|uniref:Iron hydrogenase n=1 Tax=Candidatus Staskawiczbacteria bacterium RIFOXYB1_FULL_37_44 TaxID=1802223 RepID=A0A1G2IVL5_9BACT|nr:MAG: hypothetical protein A2358_02405 [Candidatus Staskawiczbacteria bacterium RIFOXYB1_FULL_37_44]OGZ82839.1 MAG: hypothetical protein A2416_03385 [Candidatus Staskawiczbacteria bacterium RIFOXYC1_FULL_37_52]OGZ89126.1 MAG: hypothetical protein A2581_01265 [Candidatus Staskawiczbacteria bacterium RIFOXYD1_FULL_37_110]OGZ89412.1 MAG: hypothetical protein A2444_03880 [Candidatus Staskawiczbacteria bacterium RIFOXYC2_FULL_37_19]
MEEQENVISLNISKIVTKSLAFCGFLAVAVVAPYFGNQLITGSIVNALLFISASIMGIEAAFLLCLVPSLISLYTGLLPLAIAPMIPFIMTGNALLILVFVTIKNWGVGPPNFWAAAIPAAIIKYIFIFSAGTILANSILHGIAKNVFLMISWPQLATAIAGAAIAFLFLKTVKRI